MAGINLKPKEVAERLRISAHTLSNWRVKGEGPRYIKFGSVVLYPEIEVEAFEKKHIRSSTCEVRK